MLWALFQGKWANQVKDIWQLPRGYSAISKELRAFVFFISVRKNEISLAIRQWPGRKHWWLEEHKWICILPWNKENLMVIKIAEDSGFIINWNRIDSNYKRRMWRNVAKNNSSRYATRNQDANDYLLRQHVNYCREKKSSLTQQNAAHWVTTSLH